MRNAFADEITLLAAFDPRIVLLSGDIGNRLFDKFRSQFPDRFYNVGVAEADMISIAAGLALGGLRPITYTIASFSVYRCLEQIRVDVCYHHLPVVIVGAGSGLGYAANGPTHHSCEDLAVLRAMPGMRVVCPSDSWEVRALLQEACRSNDPVYLRIGKKGEPNVHQSLPPLRIGHGFSMRPGTDIAILCAGTLLRDALQAADQLSNEGISAEVVSFHTVKPLDTELLERVFRDFRLVVTVEEHSRLGGLGGAVAEWRSESTHARARLLRLGTPDEFLHLVADQEHARKVFGLTDVQIAASIREAYLNERTI
jgi:transketolase